MVQGHRIGDKRCGGDAAARADCGNRCAFETYVEGADNLTDIFDR